MVTKLLVTKLLVANRGEIARRVFRTARAMGIGTVAVFSDADEHAPHVVDADVAVRLPGTTPADTYLNIDAVLAAARSTGADAIHPGYGFLSENAGFARACAAAGITFVGPSPEAIDAMGSKIAAKELMAAAGVPVLPGATVTEGDELPDIGFPVLVKAAFGGGGRGMRVVRAAGELAEAVASVQREAAAAFGDGTVFLERYVEDPRHVEVQIFGDTHGTVLHLYERECSIQRRYQKIIEEAPSPFVDHALRADLCEAAVLAARALAYVGAGTVEFVVGADRRFAFLEVNTRLQVEHPVTEMVTGLDLVEAQLRVARGEPLPVELTQARLRGHAVEARLYAEDVSTGFTPASGRIERLRVPVGTGIRVDSGYEDGSVVSTHYDAMIAKVVAWAPDRPAAVSALASALAQTQVHGPPTNRDLLVRVLRHPDFADGATDTGFLERNDCTAPLGDGATQRIHAIAAALAGQAERRGASTIPSGWRNVPTSAQRATYANVDVAYRLRRDGLAVEVAGQTVDAVLWSATPTAVDLTVDGVRRTVHVHRVGAVVYVDDASGSSRLVEQERYPVPTESLAPGSLVATMPGSVVRVLGKVGDPVRAGDALVVIEAMKMEHRIASSTSGTLAELFVAVGDQVETGTVLAVVVGDEQDHEGDEADGERDG
ncbi:MAG: accA [Ilumatobacteraceae bacterium]|nr:accA [Ilumatobacteraceae bacterium]